jgi:hypothetical protein
MWLPDFIGHQQNGWRMRQPFCFVEVICCDWFYVISEIEPRKAG